MEGITMENPQGIRTGILFLTLERIERGWTSRYTFANEESEKEKKNSYSSSNNNI